MKLIIIIGFTILRSILFTQEISELFYGKNKDRCHGIQQVSDNMFVFARNRNTGNGLLDSLIEKNASLILYDSENKKAIKEYFIDENEDIAFIRFILNDTVNKNIIALAYIHKNNIRQTKVYRFNYNLELLNKKIIPIYYHEAFNAILNSDNNIVFVGVRDKILSIQSFIVECNSEIGLIDYKFLDSLNLFIPSSLFEQYDKYYIYSYNKKWHVLEKNFDSDTSYYPLKAGSQIYKTYSINDKTYIGSLILNTEVVYSIDTNNIQDTLFKSDYSDYSSSRNPGFYGLDGNKDGFIFFSNTIGLADPSINTSVAKNYISIHKIDTSGNLMWEYYIGGDSATYLSEHVLATKDGGCIVVFERFDLENEFGNEDVYYIKFDASGNVEKDFLENVGKPTEIKITPKIQKFLIYPNPIKNQLNIVSSNILDKKIAIYNIIGAEVYQSELKKTIDLQFLSKGNYYYSISSKNNSILQQGKLIKE